MPQALGLALGGLLFQIGAPLALVNFFAIGAGGALLFGVGVAALGGPLTRQNISVRPSDGQQAVRQAVPPRLKSFGRVRLAGAIWWWEADEASGLFHYGLALNHGKIDAFEQFLIDDAEVSIDGSYQVTTAPYNGVTTQIKSRTGDAVEDQYDNIETYFSVTDARGDGIATMLGIFDSFPTGEEQFQNYPDGRPNLRATIRASLCYDPRDGTQDPDDVTTWKWSDNEAVCRLTYLILPAIDGGAGIAWERIEPNLEAWRAAADICDEQVLSPAAGGYESRYRVALTYTFLDRPADVLKRFEAASDGRTWVKADGTIGVSVGRYTEPTVTIPAKHIIGLQVTSGQDPLTAVAGIRAQYMSPAHDYREQDAEPWPDGETVMELGDERTASLDLTCVPSPGQARRLMKRAATRAQARWRGTIRTDLYGLNAQDERFLRIELPGIGETITAEAGKFTLDLGNNQCAIEFTSIDASIDDWDGATEEGPTAGLPIKKAWQTSFTLSSDSNRDNVSIRTIVPGSAVFNSGTSQVRLSFGGVKNATLVVKHVSIVPRSASSADGTTTPTEVTFNGGDSGFTLAVGDEITSDFVDFIVTSGVDYLVTIDLQTSRGAYYSNDSSRYERGSYESWNLQSVTGFSGPSAGLLYLSQIEVR